MDKQEYFIRIGVALIAGIVIGVEREAHSRSAGLKTNALVSLGASIFMMLSLEFRGEDYVDVTRVLSQVVIGIGFIGGGVILHKKETIIGLTTAATVWCSAAAGCMAAMDLFFELLLLVVFILFINILLDPLDEYLRRKFHSSTKKNTKD